MFRVSDASAFVLFLSLNALAAGPVNLDDFNGVGQWSVITPDGVDASVSCVPGEKGSALKLDFNFRTGGGFCVVRRALELDLPENYRFSFSIRGDAPRNNLEFKLIDESGENVWWVNRHGFEFPERWTRRSYPARKFRFAWGPSGGAPLKRVRAIEFAIAAGSGGCGSVLFDSLTFEALPVPQEVPQQLTATVSSRLGGEDKQLSLGTDGLLDWRSAPEDRTPGLLIDFGKVCAFGGLAIDWGPLDYAVDYRVAHSMDGTRWEQGAIVQGGNGGRDFVPLPDAEACQVRLEVQTVHRDRGVHLRSLRILGVDFAESPNGMFETIARESKRGWYPRYLLGEQTPWTVVGVPGDEKEALIDVHGAIEVDKGGCRVEPFLLMDERLVTWADAEISQRLVEDHLPIPTVVWQVGGLTLEITALADGPPDRSELLGIYRLHNSGSRRTGKLALAVRPFQVLPPWQDLGLVGGVSSVDTISFEDGRLMVNQHQAIVPWVPPTACGVSALAQGEIVEHLSAGRLPASQETTDPARRASAAMTFPFDLAPGASRTVVVCAPFHNQVLRDRKDHPSIEAAAQAALRAAGDAWRGRLDHVTLDLPPSAERIVNTFKTTQAYILINADGPAIQPGSRTYERSWIRDGALTSTALLATGHPEMVRKYLDWYAPYQYENGKVPCIVDSRGPDPVPEHDSHGELIYTILTYYRYTRDKAFLERHLPYVTAAVDYLESIRNERLTATYRDGSAIQKACYGLVPESISHEGYCAKPMHSYWDCFFVLKGLEDATTIAEVLERTDLKIRFAALRDAFRKSLYDSMRLAMRTHGVDFIPGCVELGDFDATSTSIGVYPCNQLGRIPEPQLANTFERYYDFFSKRRDGTAEWENYTPYELRLISTFTRLGQPDRAQALLQFFMENQRPKTWNHWAEVVWRDPAKPRYIGDMPHTWVGSGFINAVRDMLIHEDGDQLVLLAGVSPAWLEEGTGVRLERFPTWFGTVGVKARSAGGRLMVEIDGSAQPPGGYRLCLPAVGSPSTVTVDGQKWEQFTDRMVSLPPGSREVVVVWNGRVPRASTEPSRDREGAEMSETDVLAIRPLPDGRGSDGPQLRPSPNLSSLGRGVWG
ncbi:MAG: coagulation factor 5/8 type domain-containing protein [bacterium]|nr:coagulation factor 5/8 type domain-containing protein [bacterium]